LAQPEEDFLAAQDRGWNGSDVEQERASRMRLSRGQLFAPLGAARGEDGAAALGFHLDAEAVLLGAAPFVGLEGAFHNGTSMTRSEELTTKDTKDTK
jgi:hypothetical protein